MHTLNPKWEKKAWVFYNTPDADIILLYFVSLGNLETDESCGQVITYSTMFYCKGTTLQN